MKFQLVSDVHLEQTPFELQRAPDADALILAGDIGDPLSADYVALVAEASKSYSWVFMVMGNHEAYGRTLEESVAVMQRLVEPFPNVKFLSKDAFDIPNTSIRVFGTTLWSSVTIEQAETVRTFVSDFRCIRGWSVERNNMEHTYDVAAVKDEINRAHHDQKQLLVVTHHAPYTRGTSRPQHDNSPFSSAFQTDLSHLFRGPVKVWVFGHTHHTSAQEVDGVKLLSNQRGIGSEPTGFNPLFVFEMA